MPPVSKAAPPTPHAQWQEHAGHRSLLSCLCDGHFLNGVLQILCVRWSGPWLCTHASVQRQSQYEAHRCISAMRCYLRSTQRYLAPNLALPLRASIMLVTTVEWYQGWSRGLNLHDCNHGNSQCLDFGQFGFLWAYAPIPRYHVQPQSQMGHSNHSSLQDS